MEKNEWTIHPHPSDERFDSVFKEGVDLLGSQDKLKYADDLHPLLNYSYVRWNKANIVRSCFRNLSGLLEDASMYDAICNVEIDINRATYLRIYLHRKDLPLSDINSWERERKVK